MHRSVHRAVLLEQAASNVVIAAEPLLDLGDADFRDYRPAMSTARAIVGLVQGGEERARLAVGEVVVGADAGVAGSPREERVLDVRRGFSLPVQRQFLDDVGEKAGELRRRKM